MYRRGAVERFCEADGVRFFTTPGKVAKGQGRWCSKRCLGVALKTSVEMACVVCGKVKLVKLSHISHGEGRFCSRKCQLLSPRKVLVRVCLFCGKQFDIAAYKIKGPNTGLYCRKSHSLAARTGIPRSAEVRAKMSAAKAGVPVPSRIVPPLPYICAGCGKADEATGPKRLKLRKGIRCFCDTECWYAFLREHPEAGGNFRGGKDPYYGPNWNEQARLARSRDGHICQDCGLHQRRPLLHVHHLVPRRMFRGDYLKANALDNLVTLCIRCHKLREVVLDATYHMTDVALVSHPVRGRAVLNLEKARKIRERYAVEDILQRELAAEYDVTQTTISRVVLGHDWPESA